MKMSFDHVAVIGGGLSGTLQAISLLRQPGPRVTLIEPSARPARGLAYSTTHPAHLLNVRARNMSAYGDAPDHFAAWLEAKGLGTADDYVPRRIYGDYLAEQLEAVAAASDNRLRIVRGAATDLERDGHGFRVTLANGKTLSATIAVLALGNLAPRVPPAFDPAVLGEAFVNDPWSAEATRGLDPSGTVLLVGTGMTMVDIALQLVDGGFDGRIIAVSRRGLLPLTHPETPPALPQRDAPPEAGKLSALLADLRRLADATGWHAATDHLRPCLQALWQSLDTDARARFLRHLRPWWDIHRHRLAPAVSARIAHLRAEGRLDVLAGKFLAADPCPEGARVRWRVRASETTRTETVARIINCTGPGCDIRASRLPLLQNLLARGLVRPGALGMGVDVTPQAQVVDRDGTPVPSLFALGPMTRGAFWEITAVPEIRKQTQALAQTLCVPHTAGPF